jgi:hypothetical protein
VIAERWHLIAQFTVAASEYSQALSEQLESVTLGNGFGLETEIAAARQPKDEAKHAILRHERNTAAKCGDVTHTELTGPVRRSGDAEYKRRLAPKKRMRREISTMG